MIYGYTAAHWVMLYALVIVGGAIIGAIGAGVANLVVLVGRKMLRWPWRSK